MTTFSESADAVRRLFPVVAFLAAILVVSGACADLGLFRAIGQRIGRPGTSGVRFLGLTFVAAVAVTAVLSLDATVVLLTPVVLAAATRAHVRPGPALSACVRLANSSSLLLPVSNLTTLLALHQLDLSFARFALVMAPAWLVVIAVEYAAHRLFFARDLRTRPEGEVEPEEVERMPRFPLAVLAVMLAAFVVGSFFDLAPAWAAAVAALVLTAHVVRRRAGTLARAVHAAHLGFAVFVLGLGVVVDALSRGGLGSLVADLLPSGETLPDLLLLALVATVLANLVNNLPATPPAGAARGAAGHGRGARHPGRPQRRVVADLDRVAGQPALAAHPDPGRGDRVRPTVPRRRRGHRARRRRARSGRRLGLGRRRPLILRFGR